MAYGKPGPAEKPIDFSLVDHLLMSGCNGAQIASHFRIHPETLYDRVLKEYGVYFSEYSHLMKEKGDGLIKARQFEKALGLNKKGDNTMLIWLGKNRLGQSENPQETKITAETLEKFNEIMNQLKGIQSVDLNIEETKSNAE
jgi:hypothetical protein